MSTYLWKYYFENDVEKFRQVLAHAIYSTSANAARSGVAGRGGGSVAIGSPGTSLSKSPTLTSKTKKAHSRHEEGNITLTRADVNWRDAHGVTLLHYIASSTKESAPHFASALLEVPFLDLYMQDAESGWTSLHRALYFGNIDIARALLSRDIQDSVAYNQNAGQYGAGGLIKIKDHEGKSPFDVYGASITNRLIHHASKMPVLSGWPSDEDDEVAHGVSGDSNEDGLQNNILSPRNVINGDEMFAFGSNKNFTLGFGDEDDRQYPERITLRRPGHLLRRLYAEHRSSQRSSKDTTPQSPTATKLSSFPAVVQYRPIIIQDVQLSKLHSAVVTTDPEANLHMCGFGSGGRLGTGDEMTRFHYVSILGGGLSGKKIIHVGLGQNHTLAITSHGEVFSWGSNRFAQLGYASATPKFPDEEPTQLLPRQIFGVLKREAVLGAAASGVHSVVYTSTSLFTFGKNDGQLGLVDSDARSLATQNTPRKVAAALFSSSVTAVSAIDKATVCLLETHDVWVFANYGYTKVAFPLENFSNYFLKSSYAATKYHDSQNYVCKITSGEDTICALSSMGDVFTVHVTQNVDTRTTMASTTNPSKIRGALSSPQRVWSMNRGQMAVTDVNVGQDGSIIICTDSGSVWRRVQRAKIKDAKALDRDSHKSKDYKFSRVPGLTRVTAVRSNTFGAYAAIRQDSDVMKSQMGVDSPALWKDLFPLLPLHGFTAQEDPASENPTPRFWSSAPPQNDTSSIRRAVLTTPDLEKALIPLLTNLELADSLSYDLRIGSTVSDVVFPVHEFILAGRSDIARQALVEFRQSYFFSIPDVASIEYDSDGKVLIQFLGADVLTVLNFVLYIYSDTVVDVWHYTRLVPKIAHRYRQVRAELMKVASHFGLKKLEQAVRVMVEPPKTLHEDLAAAIGHSEYLGHGDVEVELDGESIKVHQAMICQRCPFFQGLFNGRAGGAWLSLRRSQSQEPQAPIKVDLKHIDPNIFRMVLQYIYANADEVIFADVATTDFDSFLDLILDVMAVANELMLDRLAQCCQKMLGQFVTTRNVCQLLNAVAPCSVTEFKNAALEYICLNLEGMLENHLLDELDDEMMLELDGVVRQNQLACLPFAKSGRAEAELFEAHPELHDIIERGRRAKIDSLRLQSRLLDEDVYYANAAKARGLPQNGEIPSPSSKVRRKASGERDTANSPLRPRASIADLMFEMEELPDEATPDGSPRSTPLLRGNELHVSSRLQASSSGLASNEPASNERLEASALDINFGASASPSFGLPSQPLELASLPEAAINPLQPWATLDSSKLSMTQIMAQATSHRNSNLSSGLAIKGRTAESTATSAAAKLSQRERKRQQQQQPQPGQHDTAAPPIQAQEPEGTVKAASPWRVASGGPKISLKDVLSPDNKKSSPPFAENIPNQASTPPLTLRQTVPGSASAIRRAASGASSHPPTSKPIRSVSTPVASNKTSGSPSARRGTQSPSIRSVHYGSPAAPEASLQLSMADILAQQQTEKEVIREAVAKRSLQEIQEEQAFQEWWDQESRKVQEEEEEATRGKTVGPGGGKTSSGRGRPRNARGRGRGRGRGDSSGTAASQIDPSRDTTGTERGKSIREYAWTNSVSIFNSGTADDRAMSRKYFSTVPCRRHENPLGIPTRKARPLIPRRGLPPKRRIPNVEKVVAVSSAKGGVGKSTIAVNLALQFARNGLRSGILDADIYGPSVPTIMGLLEAGEPRLTERNHLIPLVNYGVKSMSMGYLVPQEAPVAWRGMMVVKALQQLLHEVDWGGLDMLVLDLPPGTGDTQLTIAQQVELDGVVIVSTPQDVALRDTLKGISMFQKMNVPILGMVQNMSTFICPQCSHETSIFGSTGARKAAETHNLHFLGDVPLNERICGDADRGKPTVVSQPGSKNADAFASIAKGVEEQLEKIS